ncbi:protein kinase [Nostoc carneum NIES-2107]|nr:protein kinase [Nostoc carneum NIES-2107]
MAWNPGQQLFGRRYIIERKLGEGGMGITYLAKNSQGELCVIKTLSESILNSAFINQSKIKQDFKDEALRLAVCHHPHIVKVENVFDEGDLPCMAMEYIEGEDLHERITKKGALPEAEALQYIQQIGDALTVVHAKGLLHRDLKPSNIMIRAGKPEVVLIDFGLARQFIPGEVLQHTQLLTPGYAPPEQYLEDAERGEYIDVYALAATLYSLLTGKWPISAPARLQHSTLQAPKDLNTNISDRVNEAIMKGMKLNYKSRPQSVQEWLGLLGLLKSINWECVYVIPKISETIVFSPNEDILATVADSFIHLFSSTTGKVIRTLPSEDYAYTGHTNSVYSIAFSHDGQILASSSFDKTIKLWEVATGREIRTLTGHTEGVYSVVFSHDGQMLASSSYDKTIKLWEVATGREIRTITTESSIDFLVFSTDGRILVGSHYKLWEVATGREIRTFTANYSIFYPNAISHDGSMLAYDDQNTIRLWDVTKNREIHTLNGHTESVNFIAVSNDGRMLASGSYDETIKLWNVATGKEIHTLNGHTESVDSIVFSHDGQILASSYDKTIKLWNVATGREIRTLNGHTKRVQFIAFSHNGRMLVSSTGSRYDFIHDTTIKLWEVATGREIPILNGHNDYASVAFSRDGRTLATIGQYNKIIKLWEVASGCSCKTIELREAATGKQIDSISKSYTSVRSPAFSSDMRILASTSMERFGEITLWDLATGREIRTLKAYELSIGDSLSLTFSSDGRMLASVGNKTIKLWEVATGKEIRTLPKPFRWVFFWYINSLAFSSDGRMLASSIRHTITLWEVATGKEIRTITSDRSTTVNSVAFSSDGLIVAGGESYHTITLWEVTTGRKIRTLAHSGSVYSVAFSNDGRMLASGGDNTIKLWEVATGKEICTLSHFAWVRSVAFSPDGNWLAAGDNRGNIKIWRRS